jgi:glycosyltransferase involved in cell wall biosynthesis
MEKDNILFVSNVCPFPLNYGGKVGTWEKIKELSVYYKVHLCGLIESCDYLDKIEIGKYCESFKFFPRRKNYLKCIFFFWKPYSLVSRESKKLNIYINRLIQRHKINRIVLDSIHMLYSINLAVKNNPGINVFINEHNCEWMLFDSISSSQRLFKSLIYKVEANKLKVLENNLLKNRYIKGIIFISKSDMTLLPFPKESVCLVPPSISSINKEKIDSSKSTFDLLCVANFCYQPNIFGIIWFLSFCASPLIDKNSKVRIAIVGRGIGEEIKKHCLRFPKNISFFSDVPETSSYYAQSNVVFIPLFQGGGVKIKLLEAASLGKPIVCTSKTVEGTTFNKNTVWIADNANDFVESCIEALTNKREASLKGKLAEEKFNNEYDFDSQASVYYKFIESHSN